jgi:malate dehydrogenase (oxaloacetate-decarboxylating)
LVSAASKYAAIVATGRSDYPNQINNVLAFPGFFRGMLDAQATDVTEEVMLAAAHAIADAVHPDEVNANYIVPSVFDPEVAPAVAAGVREAAVKSGVARHEATSGAAVPGAPASADPLGGPR